MKTQQLQFPAARNMSKTFYSRQRRPPGPLTDDSLCPWQRKYPGEKMADVKLSFVRWFVENCALDKEGNPNPWHEHVKAYLAARDAATPKFVRSQTREAAPPRNER